MCCFSFRHASHCLKVSSPAKARARPLPRSQGYGQFRILEVAEAQAPVHWRDSLRDRSRVASLYHAGLGDSIQIAASVHVACASSAADIATAFSGSHTLGEKSGYSRFYTPNSNQRVTPSAVNRRPQRSCRLTVTPVASKSRPYIRTWDTYSG